jgi:copper chaperone CopZ
MVRVALALLRMRFVFLIFSNGLFRLYKKTAGVESVDANVETKTVVVEAEESVSPELMLEKLKKVSHSFFFSRASNLSVSIFATLIVRLSLVSHYLQWSESSGKSVELA